MRGFFVEVADAPSDVVGAVVVSNDTWNESPASSLSVVPIKEPFAPPSTLQPLLGIAGRNLQADTPRLAHIEKSRLSTQLAVCSDDDMSELAAGLSELLDLDRLLREPPRSTRPQPGALDYPRWAEIYILADERFEGERKRYLVVSNDLWNSSPEPTVLIVRTTTSPNRFGPEFPQIQNGDARACCIEARAIPKSALELSPRSRPVPPRLFLDDMATVARGIAYALELR